MADMATWPAAKKQNPGQGRPPPRKTISIIDEHLTQPRAREARIMALAEKYHEECEAYDRQVCTGPLVYGEIMPASEDECLKITRHAFALRKRIFDEADREGLLAAEVRDAIRLTSHRNTQP